MQRLTGIRLVLGGGIFTLILAVIGPAPAQAPLKPADLVRRLASSSYQVREQAYRQLQLLGKEALADLEAGVRDPDVNIRQRCETLLPLAKRSDKEILFDAFIQGKHDPVKLPVPGWSEFAKAVGDSPATRHFYVQVYQAQPQLLDSIQQDPKQAKARLGDMIVKLRPRLGSVGIPQPPGAKSMLPEGELLAVLLVAGMLTEAPDQQVYQNFVNILNHGPLQARIRDDSAARKLVELFLERHTRDLATNGQVPYLARNLQLTDLIERRLKPLARQMAKEVNGSPQASYKLYQVVNLARQLDLPELIEMELRASVVKMLSAATREPINQNELSQVINMAASIPLREEMAVARPAVHKLALAEAAKPQRDVNQLTQLYYLAQQSGANDTISNVLVPLAQEAVREVLHGEVDLNRFNLLLNMAQNFSLEKDVSAFLTPAARALVVKNTAEPLDLNKLQQSLNIIQRLDGDKQLHAIFEQALRRYTTATVEKAPNLQDLSQLVQLARSANVPDLLDKMLKPALRKALVTAMKKPPQINEMYQVLYLIRDMKLKEGVEYSLRVAAQKDINSYARGTALLVVCELGDKTAISQLEPLLTDTTKLGQSQINFTVYHAELRDVALGVMVHLHGGSLADYGFPYFQAIRGQQPFHSSPSSFGFSDEAGRAAALKRWREQSGKQPTKS